MWVVRLSADALRQFGKLSAGARKLEKEVEVTLIGRKEGNRLIIEGEEVEL